MQHIYTHKHTYIYIHINLYHATRIFPWKRITFDFQLANWWIFHRFRLNHRGFAIRPRLAYFPRVRSPRPQGKGEGCTPSPPSLLPSSLPRGSVPPTVGGTCAVRATVNHVAATWSPKESGGGGGGWRSTTEKSGRPSGGWVSTKGKGEGMRIRRTLPFPKFFPWSVLTIFLKQRLYISLLGKIKYWDNK